jgi:thiamine biosynthesis lipoprotein
MAAKMPLCWRYSSFEHRTHNYDNSQTMIRYIQNPLYPLLLIVAFALTLTGCDQEPPLPELQKFGGTAQGTTYHISYWTKKPIELPAVTKLVEDEFRRLDKLLSNYRNDSDIEQLNAKVGSKIQPVNEEIITLIKQARTVSEASNGCYDLTIKPLFDLWGFRGDKLTPPNNANLQKTLAQIGFKQIEILDETHLRKINPALKIDLSSIAQGYSVGRLSKLLEQQGIEDYLVEIGGELQTRGKKPDGQHWRIALEKPLSGQRTLQKVVTIQRTEPLVMMTSGTYRHFFDLDGKRYSHILDAKTGRPVEHSTVSVTVFHDDPTEADAWSTALLCLGKAQGLEVAKQAGIAALFIEMDREIYNEYSTDALKALKEIEIK